MTQVYDLKGKEIESAQADEKTPNIRGSDTAKAKAGCGVGVCVRFPGQGLERGKVMEDESWPTWKGQCAKTILVF